MHGWRDRARGSWGIGEDYLITPVVQERNDPLVDGTDDMDTTAVVVGEAIEIISLCSAYGWKDVCHARPSRP
jgi:hypothetical protein